MKKLYMTPSVKVYNIKIDVMLAGSGSGPSYTSTKGDNTQEVLSKGNSGNDWDDEN